MCHCYNERNKMTKKERQQQYENKIFEGNNGEKFKVLNYFDSRNVHIEFIKTHNKKLVTARNIDVGTIRDTTEIHKEWYRTIFISNNGDEFKIVSYNNKYDVDIKFIKTGTLSNVHKRNIDSGAVKDVYGITVFGQGSFGCPNKNIAYYKKAYNTWTHMMGRCYDVTNNRYEEDKEVSDKWKCFEYFLDDIPNLIGFDQWLDNDNIHLDKDLLGNSKLYGPDTCIFLTSKENSNERSSRRN